METLNTTLCVRALVFRSVRGERGGVDRSLETGIVAVRRVVRWLTGDSHSLAPVSPSSQPDGWNTLCQS